MIPEVNIEIVDGGLGLIPASSARTSVKLGVCSRGVVSDIYSFSDSTLLQSTLGAGPAVDAAGDTLDAAGGPVLVVPLLPSTYGAAGSTTHTGTGAGTVTGNEAPDVQVLAKVTTAGIRGTAALSFSIAGGDYGTPVLTAANVVVPGMPLVTLGCAAGTYVLNEVYTIATTGVVTQSGAGPAVTQVSSPVDAYDVIVLITGGGALGAGTFKYTIDGGVSYSGSIQIPSGGTYALPGTGVIITFSAATYVVDDEYAFVTTAASFSTTDVTNGLTALLADSASWGFVHIVGTPSSAAAAATLAGVVDSSMTAAQTNFRYVFGVTECPTTESDSTVVAAFASFASRRIMVAAGDIGHISRLTGKILRRNCAWVVTSRIAGIRPGKDPAAVSIGPVPNVRSLYRDERRTPALDAGRFATMRTFVDFAGYYVTNGNMMAPSGSDFSLVQYRRVMDRACQVVRAFEIPLLSEEVRIDLKTGYIDERDAQAFEAKGNSALATALVATKDASGATVSMSRTTNLLSSGSEPVQVSIVPLAYLKELDNTIGFSNPALQ